MRKLIFTFIILSWSYYSYSQHDGKIIEKIDFTLPDTVVSKIKKRFDEKSASKILNLRYSRITYLSDGLKVTAYVVAPRESGNYPCIVSNRGGNRDFGQWNPQSIAVFLGTMASWDYVVIASQYRGNDGGEGTEEFGGRDVNDVLNLIPVLGQLPDADTTRIGIEGWSRGGMMTYLALTKTSIFKAAVVGAGLANAFKNISERPEMEQRVFSQLIPDYWKQKDQELKKRSAVYWADKICKTTPLLIMQGSSDWRVSASESLELLNKLYESKHPTRFILYEGADHGISEFKQEVNAETRRHFDYYLRDRKSLPNMKLHGR